ncbi:Flp pilus assembly protein CpaB [Bacillus timonensis]|uniref:Flp pilus assembly protein CpaB n=1 Tax=Bacillus timonensis TaxID=1033734 RepID=A0A4V3V7A0_9BACI|nr:Flp pilus assembly protein CpaB [Bacillus timonensis]THE10603.1 Flp pilus assembly protein CpaB [Bacillus timonensis]
MNGKKLWIFAITFGLFSATLFYFITESKNTESVKAAESESMAPSEQVEATEQVKQLLPIENGKRAITISVNETQGVSGFIVPGSYVDVIAISPENNSQLLVENSKVLAVGRTTAVAEDASANNYQTITLEVAPEHGIAITNATSKGAINLMLKGSPDTEATSGS